MFKGITSYFNNLKVRQKLATGFGILVFLTLLVGVVSFAATAVENNALERLQAAQQNTNLANDINTTMLEARRREKDFLLRWKIEGFDTAYDSYITLNQQHVQHVQADITTLRGRTGDEYTTQLDELDSAVQTYSDGVITVVGLLQERGFVDTGLEGEFRTAVHALEDSIGIDLQLEVLLLQMRRHEKDYLLRGDETYITQTRDTNAELKNAIQATESLSASQKTELAGLADTYLTAFNTLVDKETTANATIDVLRDQAHLVEPLVEQLVASQQTELDDALVAYQVADRIATIVQIVLVILSIITGSSLALLIASQITRQVDELDRLFRAVAVGEFDRRAQIFSKDELGQTADAINAMLRQMTSILEETEMERAALDAALNTLVATADTAEVAEQAAESAQQGNRAVSDTITAMGRIRSNTQETARRIKRLGEASQEISEVVRLIEEIADRTTVLALNASIQAASAGDAGRGFAVVAEEVQRLAERATGEARRIENLVKSIQAETNEAVVGVDEATREVVEGTRLAQQAGEQVAKLNGLVVELAGLIQGVAASTHTPANEAWQASPALAHVSSNGNGNGHG
jgi:methyl-accepting chemotaxis protein